MENNKIIKRIVTCQGSIQLVTALSILNCRTDEQQQLGYKYENYLVIYDLNSPSGQIDAFAAYIKQMAKLICDWQSIVYISPEQMKAIASQQNFTSPAKIFKKVYELVGTDDADEIYMSRNWQFGNQLFINAYQLATKICYGDSIGIYFAPDSQAFFLTQKSPKQILTKLIKNYINRIKLTLGLTVLQPINFDQGYFLLPTILNEKPPMPVIIPEQSYLLNIFRQLRSLLNKNYINQLHQKIGNADVSILLTSNLSETGRMSVEQEVEAYREFLASMNILDDSVLIIKPHPRDSHQKIEALKHSLQEFFAQIFILSETTFFFIPFEVFFLEAFVTQNLNLTTKVKVFAFSSSCLSLKLLFDVPSFIGFGNEITNKFFDPNYVSGRIMHEQDLRTALTKI
jgi:hypothetical protein